MGNQCNHFFTALEWPRFSQKHWSRWFPTLETSKTAPNGGNFTAEHGRTSQTPHLFTKDQVILQLGENWLPRKRGLSVNRVTQALGLFITLKTASCWRSEFFSFDQLLCPYPHKFRSMIIIVIHYQLSPETGWFMLVPHSPYLKRTFLAASICLRNPPGVMDHGNGGRNSDQRLCCIDGHISLFFFRDTMNI